MRIEDKARESTTRKVRIVPLNFYWLARAIIDQEERSKSRLLPEDFKILFVEADNNLGVLNLYIQSEEYSSDVFDGNLQWATEKFLW